MNAKTLILALSVLAAAASSANAATKKAKKVTPPPAQVTEPVAPTDARANVAPYECWTDEGYGRRLPCSYGGK
jgi:hypothetical protein